MFLMFGFFLAILGSLFSEISDIIGKEKIRKGEVSVYTTGFLMLVFGVVFLFIHASFGGSLRFSPLSLPTLIIRIILEIILSWVTITALAKANRSTFGFVRTLTVPLLLVVDIFMGYAVSFRQILGIVVISAIIASFVALSGKFEKRGIGLLLLSAILPVAPLSIYKYDINHFNSVEAEQILVALALGAFFLLMAIFRAKENPIRFLLKPIFFLQALLVGLASVIGSFAYLFLLPSVATAIFRSGAVLFSTLSGDFYFREKKPLLKFFVAIGIIGGLLLLL